jgi:hypothetical protein
VTNAEALEGPQAPRNLESVSASARSESKDSATAGGAARAELIERIKSSKDTLRRFRVVAAVVNPDSFAEARNKSAPLPSPLYVETGRDD